LASALSSANALPARVLKLRAQIALGQPDEALAAVESDADTVPDLAAVRALARQAAGQRDAALQEARALAHAHPDSAAVQVLAGTVLQAHGESEAALALLARHEGNIEA
ncbi:hypothetical protein KEM52_004799, partial [Ascosphaera acerosa]